MPGDPGRCGKIARYLEEPEHIGSNREFNIWRGGFQASGFCLLDRNERTFDRHCG